MPGVIAWLLKKKKHKQKKPIIMMNFAEEQEDNSTVSRKVYLGKRSFIIAAVNPNEAWMKANGFYVSEDEFKRTGTMQTKNKPEGVKNRFAKIDIYIKDALNLPDSIIIKASYMLQERYNMSNDGGKCQIINKYGGSLWVPTEEAKTLQLSNPYIGQNPFVLDNIKPALVGEEGLVAFIRALRNLNNVKEDTTQEDRKKLSSMFDKKDLDKLFQGDFKDITALLMAGSSTIGFLLGAKTSDKGTVYQDFFRDMPMRPYQIKGTKDEYLCKRVTDNQSNSRYPNTYFDLQDLSFREYVEATNAVSPTGKEDLFADSSVSNGTGFGAVQQKADPFGATSGGFGADPSEVVQNPVLSEEETNDLPF
jgi:hypothetical protein